jgi:hypothetical protein
MRLRSIMIAGAVVTALLVPATAAQGATKLRTALSLSAPTSAPYGAGVTLSGRLWRYGTPYGIRSQQVWLQRSPHGKSAWSNVKYAWTTASGTYSFTVTQTAPYDYRAYYKGSATWTAALSPVRYPVVNQNVLLDTIATTNYDTGAIRATGRVFPVPPNGTPVWFQRWDSPRQAWYTVTSARTSSGRVTVNAVRPASVAAYRLVVAPRAPYGNGVSAARWFAHHVWRGAFHRPVVTSTPGGSYEVWTPTQAPKRDTVTLRINEYTTQYTFGVNTVGCTRIAAAVSLGSSPTQVGLVLHTDRLIDDGSAASGGPAVTLSGVLYPTDREVKLQMNRPSDSSAVYLTGNFKVLCAN